MALSPSGGDTCLFAIVSDGGYDGRQGLEAHGDVQQVSSEEEVIVVSQDGHGDIPDQVEERLKQEEEHKICPSSNT